MAKRSASPGALPPAVTAHPASTAIGGKALSTFTDNELMLELKKREEDRQRAAIKERDERSKLTLDYASVLVQLASHHDRIACDENNPAHMADHCARCRILDAISCKWWDSTWIVKIEIIHDELPDPDNLKAKR